MSNLFPVFKSEEEENESNKLPNSWLTIGSSFDDIAFKKKEAIKNKGAYPQQDSNQKAFPSADQSRRKTAMDLNAMDSDSSEEEEKKKKKKHKKKKDKKKLAVYDPVSYSFHHNS